MRLVWSLGVSTLWLVIPCHVLRAQGTVTATPSDADALSKMLMTASAWSLLETDTTPPFHLQASFSTFDYLGKPDGTGTLEVFWDGKQRSKQTVNYRGLSQTIIKDRDEFTTGEPFHRSLAERSLLDGLLTPLPAASGIEGSDLSLKTLKFGDVALDCVSVTPKRFNRAQGGGMGPVFVGPKAYCLTQKSSLLRLLEFPTQLRLAYDQLEAFGRKVVAHSMTMTQGKIVRARLQVESLTSWTASDATFVAPPGAVAKGQMPVVGGGVIAGSIVSKQTAVYPVSARLNHIAGDVVLAAIISKTGTVQDLEVISSPDENLSLSALTP